MSNTLSADPITSKTLHKAVVKEVIRVTIILSVLTIIELILGFSLMDMPVGLLHYFIKGVIVILMLVKAFYIVAYFMHLKHEKDGLIFTIVVPLFIFIWFIFVFLYEGNSFQNLKSRYSANYQERATMMAPSAETQHVEKH
ncbi:MAG: cytochrome C oxidase subunit IV family protein [Phycisphaerales bacterium]|nr:cytochrome C oxidase subunit IV family protein [Phycisphaerales bacterium]